MERDTLCFTCGQAVTDPARFNRLDDDRPCPSCAERAIDAVSPALPARGSKESPVEATESMGPSLVKGPFPQAPGPEPA